VLIPPDVLFEKCGRLIEQERRLETLKKRKRGTGGDDHPAGGDDAAAQAESREQEGDQGEVEDDDVMEEDDRKKGYEEGQRHEGRFDIADEVEKQLGEPTCWKFFPWCSQHLCVLITPWAAGMCREEGAK
jgi:hypothetical protein